MKSLRISKLTPSAAGEGEEARPAAAKFRFRFVARGNKANTLVRLAVASLRRCHPTAGVVVVDANDEPALTTGYDIDEYADTVHVRPADDAIAMALGRGSRQHMFYWRHSPQLREALPPTDQYDVHADADMIFLRPMDLTCLLRPMEQGRIAASVDESTIDYFGRLGNLSAGPTSGLPAAGGGGPLLQAGLLFANPANDGQVYDHFWQLATDTAKAGHLAHLPFDDMCILTSVLGHHGPLWGRLLPLGHEWNYITDAQKDPGVFGIVAHYGGHKAKALLLSQRHRMFPLARTALDTYAWGSVCSAEVTDRLILGRGPWPFPSMGSASQPGHPTMPSPLAVPTPFSLTWRVPEDATTVQVSTEVPREGRQDSIGLALFIYRDGCLLNRLVSDGTNLVAKLSCAGAETLTVIATTLTAGYQAQLTIEFRDSEGGRARWAAR